MSLLHVLSYAGAVTAFLFVTLSLASGLLWLAELIEEHSKMAKVVGIRMVYGIMLLHILLLLIDRLPFLPILFSLFCHFIYLQNFTNLWPFISLTSPRFLLSCILVVADHFLWFFHFAEKSQKAMQNNRPQVGRNRYGNNNNNGNKGGNGTQEVVPTFMDVAAFFAVCVWLVPLFLFLSLSANDNVLPSLDVGTPMPTHPDQDPFNNPNNLSHPSHPSHASSSQHSSSIVKNLLTPLLAVLPNIRSNVTPGRRVRSGTGEGLIAPHSPMVSKRNTPLPSPGIAGYSPWGSMGSMDGSNGGGGTQMNSLGRSMSSNGFLAPSTSLGSLSGYHTPLTPSSSAGQSQFNLNMAGSPQGNGSGKRRTQTQPPPPPKRTMSELSIGGPNGSGIDITNRGLPNQYHSSNLERVSSPEMISPITTSSSASLSTSTSTGLNPSLGNSSHTSTMMGRSASHHGLGAVVGGGGVENGLSSGIQGNGPVRRVTSAMGINGFKKDD